jgi:hypothetical protein
MRRKTKDEKCNGSINNKSVNKFQLHRYLHLFLHKFPDDFGMIESHFRK